MRFWLGSHMPGWLGRTAVPLFISHRRLRRYRTLPRALGPWALDSGGFSELSLHGRWETSPASYAKAVARYRDEVGELVWAAPQDWMCEPPILAKTGLTVADHQQRTVASYLDLRAAGLPVVPVLQGWTPRDYLACLDLYTQAGVDLAAAPLVGLGSVCRRQHTGQIRGLVSLLAARGLRLHGFGVKLEGLGAYADLLASADSLAWSYDGRRSRPLDGCRHRNCANCLPYALAWRERVLAQVERQALMPSQQLLEVLA